jgi:hypothetical protein
MVVMRWWASSIFASALTCRLVFSQTKTMQSFIHAHKAAATTFIVYNFVVILNNIVGLYITCRMAARFRSCHRFCARVHRRSFIPFAYVVCLSVRLSRWRPDTIVVGVLCSFNDSLSCIYTATKAYVTAHSHNSRWTTHIRNHTSTRTDGPRNRFVTNSKQPFRVHAGNEDAVIKDH